MCNTSLCSFFCRTTYVSPRRAKLHEYESPGERSKENSHEFANNVTFNLASRESATDCRVLVALLAVRHRPNMFVSFSLFSAPLPSCFPHSSIAFSLSLPLSALSLYIHLLFSSTLPLSVFFSIPKAHFCL